MAFIPGIEQKSLEEQRLFQNLKLKELLQYLKNNSPYYQRLFLRENMDIHTISDLGQLSQLPTTTKEDLQRYNWDFLCIPHKEIREYVATSGTLGNPVTIALSQKDLDRLAYNEYLSFNCMELTEEDVVQLSLTLDRQFMAGIAYYGGLNKIGSTTIRTGPGLPAMQWQNILQLGVTAMVAVPSFLIKMLDEPYLQQLHAPSNKVKKILAIGESLRNESLEPNALLQRITKSWPVQLYSTYASTEMQTAFTECSHGQGGHHHPELIIVEILDDNGNPVSEGEKGEVTITTLGVEAMPLLRYRTGDICKAYYGHCNCGRKTMRLGPVLGRKQQMIKFKGTTIYPNNIFNVLHQIEAIQDYVVEVKTGDTDQDELCLFLATDLDEEDCTRIIKPIFQHNWRVLPHIQYLSLPEIIKLQFPNGERKPIRFKDLRN